MAHDTLCPIPGVPLNSCAFCRVISHARSQERVSANETWRANLPLVEQRVAKDERAAVEKRVRESGVARWLPSHGWDTLVTAIRGTR